MEDRIWEKMLGPSSLPKSIDQLKDPTSPNISSTELDFFGKPPIYIIYIAWGRAANV